MKVLPLTASLPLLLFTFAPPANANPVQHAANTTTTGKITWSPCVAPNPTEFQCATLKVPLDYTNKSSTEKLDLRLLRLPAAIKTAKRRSIFLNFGGPGAPGIADFHSFWPRLQAASGGIYDLITPVPRGTNETLPFSCYADSVSRTLGTPSLAGNASDVALGQVWAQATLFSDNCAVVQNKTGRFVGSAFVARDMMQVVDALEEDGLLRYWGVSYGTLLGSTAVAMFPDKVDKVVLDGVVNPFEYYVNQEVQVLTQVDATFEGFLSGCVQNPKLCPMGKNHTVAQLAAEMEAFFETLKYNPVPLPAPGTPGGGSLLDYSLIKTLIQPQLDYPTLWPTLGQCLSELITGIATASGNSSCASLFGGDTGSGGSAAASPGYNPSTSDNSPTYGEALQGIKCGDVRVHTSNFTSMVPLFEARHRVSRWFGDVTDEMPARCAQWKLPAKEIYAGDFNVKPRSPVLLVGNTHDPVTPFISAQNVTDTFAGSALIQHDSYGHDSLMKASLCTASNIRAYFVNGTLPKKGTKCAVKVPMFSEDDGWDEVIKQLKANPNTIY